MQKEPNMNETKRLFIALPLPQNVKEEIWENLGKKLLKEKLSIVKKDYLHATLCFLGNRTIQEERNAQQALGKINQTEFEVELFGISEFNRRVLFVQITRGAKELEKISKDLAGHTGMCGGKFQAHVTIARNKKMQSKEFLKLVEKLDKENEKTVFLAKEITLFESKLSPHGAVYTSIFSKKLE